MNVIFKKEATEDELPALARTIKPLLGESFVLRLDGPMGAGKSTFVRNFLWHEGLSRRIPVTSPTYTYMNEYEVNGRWFAHLDLYRVQESFDLDEIGFDHRTFSGVFIEWFDMPQIPLRATPTHQLRITPRGEDKRQYELMRLG